MNQSKFANPIMKGLAREVSVSELKNVAGGGTRVVTAFAAQGQEDTYHKGSDTPYALDTIKETNS